MYIDALGLVSDAQAFGAAAVSTNSIDLGVPQGSGTPPAREIGTGEPVGFGFQIDVAGTVAASLLEIISATDAALTTSIVVHASRLVPLASAVAGALFFLGLPPGTPTQRYLGVRVTTAGGTVSLTAWLTAQDLFSILSKTYAKNYAV